MTSRSRPVRTCVGCGRREERRLLVRFVLAPGGRLEPDLCGRRPGRGAYLHRDAACWQAFARRKGPVRSLRAAVMREQRRALVAELCGSNLE